MAVLRNIVGSVKWFDGTRGFFVSDAGRETFIRGEDLTDDVKGQLLQGNRFKWDVEPDSVSGKHKATNIVALEIINQPIVAAATSGVNSAPVLPPPIIVQPGNAPIINPPRMKLFPEGDEEIRATGISLHIKDIESFDENNKLASQRFRLSSNGSFTLIDMLTGNILQQGTSHAKDVNIFQWDTPAEGIQTIGFRFSGARELSFRLVHVATGQHSSFKLRKR